MELSLFKKSYLSKLGESNTPYKIISSAAYNDKFGNVRIYCDEYKDGWMHLIYIDEKVYVLPNSLHFHAPTVKFPKSAAIIPFATLSPFNPSFLGEVRAYKKNEFKAVTMKENVSRGELMEIAHSVGDLLEYKNEKYGNSALAPLDIFKGKCKVGDTLDHKLARIKNSTTLNKNDVVDVAAYLILTCKEFGWKTFNEFKD